jgi:hypothetical protein
VHRFFPLHAGLGCVIYFIVTFFEVIADAQCDAAVAQKLDPSRGTTKLGGAFDHAHIALNIAGAKRLERLLVGGRVMAGEGLVRSCHTLRLVSVCFASL